MGGSEVQDTKSTITLGPSTQSQSCVSIHSINRIVFKVLHFSAFIVSVVILITSEGMRISSSDAVTALHLHGEEGAGSQSKA